MEILNKADIGVFGGSGFYSFLKDVEEVIHQMQDDVCIVIHRLMTTII